MKKAHELYCSLRQSSSRSTSRTMPSAIRSSVRAGSNAATTIVSLLAKQASTTLQCLVLFAMSQPCGAEKIPETEQYGTTTDALLRLSFLGGLMVFALGWDWLTTTTSHNSSPKTEKTKKTKRKMAYKNKKRKLFHIRVALAARKVGTQRKAHKRLYRRRGAATTGIPLAFPWVRCCPGPNDTKHGIDLAGGGGAGGSTATKRKRWNKQPGLAAALMQVLNHYDRGNNQYEENRNKRQRHTTWSQHDPGGTRQGQDNSLANTLLQLLQTQQFNSDAQLANTIISTINQHGANTSQQTNRQKPPRFATATQHSPPQAAHDRGGGKSNNRWNKPKMKADINQLAAAEWTTPPRLIRYNQLIDAIKKQERSHHNIVEITTPLEFDTLCTYWTTCNFQQAITLICTGEALHTTGNTYTSAKIKRQHATTYKVENISLKALGDKAQCPWPFTSSQFKAADIPKVERSTIRIAAPQEYRQHYYEKDSAKKNLTDIATWYIDGFTTTTLSGGRWTKQWAGHKEQFELLVGFVKLDQKLVPQLLQQSGKHGIFFNVVEEAATRKSMQWFPRDKDISTNNYLEDCLHEAKRQKQNLHFRKGGTNNLGIPCAPGQHAKPTHVIARGVPDSWEFEELQHLLTTQGWLDTKVINKYKRSHTITEWHILGRPPSNQATQESWHYTGPGVADIHLVQAPTKQRPQSWQQNIRGPARLWQPQLLPASRSAPAETPSDAAMAEANSHRRDQDQDSNAEGKQRKGSSRSPRRKPRATERDTEVPAAQIDPSQKGPSSSQPQPKNDKKILPSPMLPTPYTPMEAISQGWTRHDLKGTGDCAYRAISGARHYAKTGEHIDTDVATTEAAELRAQCVIHCKKHAVRFQTFFAPDKEENAHQRNNKPAATTFHEWIDNQADPRTWACSYSLQAIAERTGMPIVVFKKPEDSDKWIRTLFASKFSRGKACAARQEHPVVVVLENHHYTYLSPPPEGKIPPNWLTGESNPDCAVIDLTGDGVSDGTASVHTMLTDHPSRTNTASRSTAAVLATATAQHGNSIGAAQTIGSTTHHTATAATATTSTQPLQSLQATADSNTAQHHTQTARTVRLDVSRNQVQVTAGISPRRSTASALGSVDTLGRNETAAQPCGSSDHGTPSVHTIRTQQIAAHSSKTPSVHTILTTARTTKTPSVHTIQTMFQPTNPMDPGILGKTPGRPPPHLDNPKVAVHKNPRVVTACLPGNQNNANQKPKRLFGKQADPSLAPVPKNR